MKTTLNADRSALVTTHTVDADVAKTVREHVVDNLVGVLKNAALARGFRLLGDEPTVAEDAKTDGRVEFTITWQLLQLVDETPAPLPTDMAVHTGGEVKAEPASVQKPGQKQAPKGEQD